MAMRPNAAIYAKIVAVAIIWGGTYVAGAYLGKGVNPVFTAFIRFALASIILLLWLATSRVTMITPTKRQIAHLAVLGFFGIFLYNICFFFGLCYTTATRASLIICLDPALIALFSAIYLRERLNRIQICGICLCIIGASLVIISKGGVNWSGSLKGDCLILGCVISWVVYTVAARGIIHKLGAALTVAWSIWLGAIMFIPVLPFVFQGAMLKMLANITLPQWLSLIYLGAAGSALAYIWYYEAIRQLGPTKTGAFIALNPLTAVIFGALLLGDALTPLILLGGALAISGVYLCNIAKK